MSDVVEVSVVLPAYNEEDTIADAVEETLDALEGFLPQGSYEVVVAEDGCTDQTPEIVEGIADDDGRVRHVHSDRRLGRGQALRSAFMAAAGDVLAYLDTDLATDMTHLEELIEAVRSGEFDVATGSRWVPGHEVKRPPRRGVPSRVYNGIVRTVLGSSLRDHQCGFKAFDRGTLDDLLPSVVDNHWFWDTEVLVRAQRAGYRVYEFPVGWSPQGDTKVDLVRDVLGMGSQVIRLGWELRVRPHVTRGRTVVVGVLLTAVALALMGLYLPFGEVLSRIARADPVLLAVAAAVYLASWPLRGIRYRDILAELGFREGAAFLTGAVFVSQTGNLVFPARAGDAIRAYVVKTRRAVPYPAGFASLTVERVFDLLTITAMAGVVLVGLVATGNLPTLSGAAVGDAVGQSGRTALQVAAVVSVAAIATVLLILWTARSSENRVRRAIHRVSDDSYARYVARVVERFAGDVQAVATDREAFAIIGAASLLIWGIDVATAVVVFAAFSPSLSLGAIISVSFFAVSVGNLAKVLPLSPGGIGLYEGAFTLLVVALTGVPWQLALGVAIVDHAVKNAVTLAGGLTAMVVLNVSLTTAVEEGSEAATAEGD